MDLNNTLLSQLLQHKKPELFEKSTSQMWTDDYISQQMLFAHLDPTVDAASRKLETINSSVRWIDSYICNHNQQLEILDLGCGPGLYTLPLANLGYSVTGIDFSKLSIEYAEQVATGANLPLRYINKDYLTATYPTYLDVVLMIYCDFGVLDDRSKDTLLQKVYSSLKPGGVFMFDVFRPQKYHALPDSKSWYVVESGFWRSKPHLCLDSSYWYEESEVHLNQSIIVDEQRHINVYNNWDTTYSKEKLQSLLNKHGFDQLEFYNDTTGTAYHDQGETLCVIARKPHSLNVY